MNAFAIEDGGHSNRLGRLPVLRKDVLFMYGLTALRRNLTNVIVVNCIWLVNVDYISFI